MRTIFITLVTLFLSIQWLNATSLQSTVDAQALEIKQLKRALGLKEQELKVLLITIKNSKLESMLHTDEQQLEFKDVSDVSATRVVVKPSMLSETAIKEIDHGGDTDTDTIEESLKEAIDPTAEVNDTEAGDNENTEIIDKQMADPKKVDQVIPKMTHIKPSTFALTMNTQVYKKLFAKDGEKWTKGMRFTSNKKRGSWIQITGRITDMGWKQVNSELWIDENCVEKIR